LDARRRAEEEAAIPGMALTAGWTLEEAYLLECYLHELDTRANEALAVYRPVPGAKDVHACLAGEIGLVGSNRAGKSVCAGAECALAATGRHPLGDKYPTGNLEIALVGPGERHLRLLYRILFKPGQFRLIQDPDGSWRVPSYDNPEDVAREREWVAAPPLIPERMIESETWISKAAEQPALIRLINGTSIYFYSFDANPPQGVVFHLVWMDEEHPRARVWLNEMRARVMSVKGRIIWSATPENATPTFYALKSRADRPDMASKPPIAQTKFFELLSKDNPFIPPEGREAFFERLREDDPEAAVAKVEGEWAFRRYLVYPEFDANRHMIDPFEITHEDTMLVVIDPSITRCGILMAAILSPDSPHFLPEWPDRIVLIDEAVIDNCKSTKAARRVREMMDRHKHWLEMVVFDLRHGRKREDDEGTIAEKYWAALKEAGVHPRIDRIVWGGDNFTEGIDTVKEFLDPKGGLPPRIVGMKDRVPWWQWEMQRYHRVRDKRPESQGAPGKVHRKKDDLCDCTRYLCLKNPQWVAPPGLDHRMANAYSAEELRQLERDPINSMYAHLWARPDKKKQRNTA